MPPAVDAGLMLDRRGQAVGAAVRRALTWPSCEARRCDSRAIWSRSACASVSSRTNVSRHNAPPRSATCLSTNVQRARVQGHLARPMAQHVAKAGVRAILLQRRSRSLARLRGERPARADRGGQRIEALADQQGQFDTLAPLTHPGQDGEAFGDRRLAAGEGIKAAAAPFVDLRSGSVERAKRKQRRGIRHDLPSLNHRRINVCDRDKSVHGSGISAMNCQKLAACAAQHWPSHSVTVPRPYMSTR